MTDRAHEDATELQVVDAQGRPRILLSARPGFPMIALLDTDGRAALLARADAANRPAIVLSNPDEAGPVAAIEIDDKGAHIKFDRPGGASAYLFLNAAGGSGVVLTDGEGRRRVHATLSADGTSSIERLSDEGHPI